MPYTKDGIVPDIIMSPSAIPSRMTIAHMIECIFGKVGTVAGAELDATPFTKVTVEDITEIMEKLGYNGAGTEILYNGKTGEQMEAAIFIGPTFYYRLKHLVEDKQHCIDYETEILTKNGWKKHNELKISDEIATLCADNSLKYEKPIEIFDYPTYQGSMYYIKTATIDLAVTGEHRMWVSENGMDFKFMKAKEIIGKKVLYKKNIDWQYNIGSIKTINDVFGSYDKYETPLKQMANTIQIEALYSGFACDIEHKDEQYICKLYKDENNAWVDNNIMEEFWVEEEKKPVWCVHVPSEVFLIRRNGKVCWTGNSRATGPYQLLTMQPAEGRSRDGGFRFGEMERDCILSHGSVQFLKERLFNCSDKYVVWIDKETGTIAPVNEEKGIYKSLYSENTTRFAKVQIPYSTKLLIQELTAMGILPRLFTK